MPDSGQDAQVISQPAARRHSFSQPFFDGVDAGIAGSAGEACIELIAIRADQLASFVVAVNGQLHAIDAVLAAVALGFGVGIDVGELAFEGVGQSDSRVGPAFQQSLPDQAHRFALGGDGRTKV